MQYTTSKLSIINVPYYEYCWPLLFYLTHLSYGEDKIEHTGNSICKCQKNSIKINKKKTEFMTASHRL